VLPHCGALGEDAGGVDLASDSDRLLGERGYRHDASSEEWWEDESRPASRLDGSSRCGDPLLSQKLAGHRGPPGSRSPSDLLGRGGVPGASWSLCLSQRRPALPATLS
jgi:hypothetical protein